MVKRIKNLTKEMNTTSHYKGWDIFYPNCDTVSEMFCKACDMKMNVRRHVNGPRSWAESMAHLTGNDYADHDCFTCPNSGKPWHNQVIALKIEARNTASSSITKIIEEEMYIVLRNKTVTKTNWREY